MRIQRPLDIDLLLQMSDKIAETNATNSQGQTNNSPKHNMAARDFPTEFDLGEDHTEEEQKNRVF